MSPDMLRRLTNRHFIIIIIIIIIIRDVSSPSIHPYITIFEPGLRFDPRMMPWKFCDIS